VSGVRSAEVVFELGGAFGPGLPHSANAHVLNALLEARIALDIFYLRMFPNSPALYQSGIRYGRTKKWLSYDHMLALGYADCKSLVPQRIAELRLQGVCALPMTSYDPRQPEKYHVRVMLPNGQFEDPSRRLGMT
jgi:hypothetical protein